MVSLIRGAGRCLTLEINMASRKGCCVAALVYEHLMEGDISRPQIFHKKTKAVSIRCMVYCALIFEVPSNRNLCSTFSLWPLCFFT